MESRNHKGEAHIVASVRADDINEIIANQLDVEGGGAGAVLLTNQLNKKQLAQMEDLQKKHKLTLTSFYAIAPEYLAHVNAVQRLFAEQGLCRRYTNIPGAYVKQVLAAMDNVLDMDAAPRIREAAVGMRRELRQRALQVNTKRSDLWPILGKYKLNAVERDFLGRWGLIIQYNRHIAENDGFENAIRAI